MLPLRLLQLSTSTLRFNSNPTYYFTGPSLPAAVLRTLTTSTTPLLARSQDDPDGGCSGLDHEIIADKGVVQLQCESSADGGTCRVYLVGTCHISQKSCQDVKAVINYVKPQAVFLELCQRRLNMLTNKTHEDPTKNEMLNVWKNKKGNPSSHLSGQILKMISELEVIYGAEMRVGYEEARSCGASVYLGDRPSHITSSRVINAITKTSELKLYQFLFNSDIWKQKMAKMKLDDVNQGDELKYFQMMLNKLDDEDTMAANFQALHEAFPPLMDTLVMERDKYMSSTLWKVARKHSSVVAVVGKGHLPGIKKYWMQPIEVESLLQVPSEKENSSNSNNSARATTIKDLLVAMFHYQSEK